MQKSSCVSLLDLFSSRMEKPTDFPQLSHRSHATRSASETCVKKKMNKKDTWVRVGPGRREKERERQQQEEEEEEEEEEDDARKNRDRENYKYI